MPMQLRGQTNDTYVQLQKPKHQ